MTRDIDIPLPPKQANEGLPGKHEPVRDWQVCGYCAAALRLTWNDMANTPLAPMGPLALVDWIRATARTKFDAMVRVGA